MGEKRGSTEKMLYDFNAAACLEVQLPNENWYRITSREFRSYSYPRRILVGKVQYINDVDPRTLIQNNKKYGRR